MTNQTTNLEACANLPYSMSNALAKWQAKLPLQRPDSLSWLVKPYHIPWPMPSWSVKTANLESDPLPITFHAQVCKWKFWAILGSMVERPFSLLFPHILSPVGPSQPWLPVLLDIEGNMWHVKVVVHPIVYNHAMISSEFLLSTLVSVVSSCLTSTIKSALYCCSKLNWNCSRFGLSF